MSYSFSVKAATKVAAIAAVAAKMAETVAQQPIHARDEAAVNANAKAVIEFLADDDKQDISVYCSGYLSWMSSTSDPAVTSAKVECSASHTTR